MFCFLARVLPLVLVLNRNANIELIMAHTFEELKPGIDKALHYLKTCEDFTTDEAQKSFEVLQNASFPSGCSNRHKVAKYLTGEGFGQLFVTMWNSLCEFLDREKWETSGYTNLVDILVCYQNYCGHCPELGVELGKHGCIPLLLAGLEKLKAYFNEKSEFEIIQYVVSSIFSILHNSIRQCRVNRDIYRKAGAVDILKVYLKQFSVSTDALMTLAYIVKESESEILAESDVGVPTLVQLLQKAVISSNHTVDTHQKSSREVVSGFSNFDLLDCLNHLAINDDNKRAIEKHGGIPAITCMLQDEFTEEEQTVAVEALRNLAFIDSIRQSDQLQDALPGK